MLSVVFFFSYYKLHYFRQEESWNNCLSNSLSLIKWHNACWSKCKRINRTALSGHEVTGDRTTLPESALSSSDLPYCFLNKAVSGLFVFRLGFFCFAFGFVLGVFFLFGWLGGLVWFDLYIQTRKLTYNYSLMASNRNKKWMPHKPTYCLYCYLINLFFPFLPLTCWNYRKKNIDFNKC